MQSTMVTYMTYLFCAQTMEIAIFRLTVGYRLVPAEIYPLQACVKDFSQLLVIVCLWAL